MGAKSALVIAGFDPSGGAGLLSDVAIFAGKSIDVKSCVTCNTSQNFTKCYWVEQLPEKQILNQLNHLLEDFRFDGVKIGAFPNLNCLKTCLDSIKEKQPGIPIVWDPVIKASKGASFVGDINKEVLIDILGKIDLITPNRREYNTLKGVLGMELSELTNTLVTGFMVTDTHITDALLSKKEVLEFTKNMVPGKDIHGSGCKYSALITAHLILGNDLVNSISESSQEMYNLYQTIPC
ncbi:bifunctional hydroxymethylpyrimidine kinase/phosphomethylpyrimidine kinase [Luteibaculum oceani]|uniref:Pyridoxamine kinase/Phosphomethylpyrimidine kinase domain-containing protein n=1 Tax=Luteibaculum oceani TaxID=1294296 RepID=A0A5C6UZF0_9FLAO|nr:bifunctional hydroxymethylpyrimidine kinase/phosphomethylpyrimidine kinase [Luteibaculum oceani]TXC78647.1 hypothetical protein FRX97_07985 [Luteibaculum oceani]